jgi:hypothetical protein
MKLEWFVALAITFGVLVGHVEAQSPEYRSVENPFQDEFDYRIGTTLHPEVEIDGVRWVRFTVQPKEGVEIVADETVPITVELGFVNRRVGGAQIVVIALFETADGSPLDRVECKTVRAGGDRPKEAVQKFKLPGSTLLATRKIYLFAEVKR